MTYKRIPACRYLERAEEAYEIDANGRERPVVDYVCGWADAHADKLVGFPNWVAKAAYAGAAPFDSSKHCNDCSAFEPVKAETMEQTVAELVNENARLHRKNAQLRAEKAMLILEAEKLKAENERLKVAASDAYQHEGYIHTFHSKDGAACCVFAKSDANPWGYLDPSLTYVCKAVFSLKDSGTVGEGA